MTLLSGSIVTKQSIIEAASGDVLFNYIEKSQAAKANGGPTDFGTFLDAGTGTHSLRWIASLLHRDDIEIKNYTAITADPKMQQSVMEEAAKFHVDESGDILIGNWAATADETSKLYPESNILCQGQTFDVILADYLIGAMDGFSPFYQDSIFDRLKSHLNPETGRLYIVGLEPLPESADGDANLICEMTKMRDACILLANHRCYREYPVTWVLRQLEKNGFNVVDHASFPNLYSHHTISRQLRVARSKLPYFRSKELADQMRIQIDDLDRRAAIATEKAPNQRLKVGFDYVIVAEIRKDDDAPKEPQQDLCAPIG